MKCPRCQAQNREGVRFCEDCGARLALSCPSCGAEVTPGKKFCGSCGGSLAAQAEARVSSPQAYTPKHLAERILTSRSALEGERKQVTILFADLKGSMELLADRDPEEARKLLDPVLELMMEAVHRYEGTVNQVLGDGIMALFGAPLAHEDHAVRACYAALRMQETVKRYAESVRRTEGIPIQIRVGLNSGEVVVRSIGSDLHMDYTAVGQTTHLAARMEQMAMSGSILMTGEVLRLAEGFVAVRPLGPVPVKGLGEPVEVYELTGPGAARTRLQAVVARGLTRFVGRETEMEALRRAIGLVSEGHGQVVGVVGEPGVGKSRLFWEFTHSHRTHGWLVLESASLSHGKATAYLPLADLLREYFRIEGVDDARRVAEKITGKVLTLDRALEPHLPALLALLDAPVDDPGWARMDPHQRRRETLEAARRLLLRESQSQPLVIVFEDLHWLDSETQAFLDRLVESLPASRVLLLVNHRPEYSHEWGRKTYYTQLRLDPLTPASAGELLDALLGADPGLATLKSLLVARTEGNPFFLEECVRTMVETGTIAGERGAYHLARPTAEVQVPGTVQAVLAARIDRLPAENKRLLQAAAVIGKDVPFALLEAIASLPDEALRRGLGELQTAEFLYEARLFPDLEYTFKHALTHAVAYQSLLRSTRQRLHERIARVLQDRFGTTTEAQPELLAHHLTEAGLAEEAIAAWQRAGARAVSRSAFVEGIAHLRRGLALLEELPASPERARQEMAFQLALGGPLVATRGYAAPEILEAYSRAHALCRETGETHALFDVVEGLWAYYYVRAELEKARQLGEQLLAQAERDQDDTRLLRAHVALGCTTLSLGEFSIATTHLGQALGLHDPGRHLMLMTAWGADPGVIALVYLALAQEVMGHVDRALATARRAFATAQPQPHSFTMAWALMGMAGTLLRRGEPRKALESVEALVTLSREQGFAQWLAQGMIYRATARSWLGPPAEAIPELHEGLVAREATGARVVQPLFASLLANVCLRAGAIDAGLEVVAAALGDADRTGDHAADAALWRTRGELVLARGDETEGEACLERSLAIARRQETRLMALGTATVLARLWQRRGDRERARELLAPLYAWFSEGFDTPTLKAASALLAELT